eukprot:gnl/MRDRNA2_/MRDRNA2_30769_c0_seq1.p1 gnl/MRDRNA2_/MRDRNA2_30769_c0~~gnl/MRDRNA2_/MRDRNA2_30769_c0_seq1.p1  ORF type:complete len:243 (+),score=39.06 gnl/MRDRNA2_/MRDRNA2_30769_c0_seq1:142-870(+)
MFICVMLAALAFILQVISKEIDANHLKVTQGSVDEAFSHLSKRLLESSSFDHLHLDNTMLRKPESSLMGSARNPINLAARGNVRNPSTLAAHGFVSPHHLRSGLHHGVLCPTRLDAMRLAAKLNEQDALDGAIAPMKIAIESGFKEGKSVVWGVFQQDLDEGSVPDSKERASRRAAAAKALTNIDSVERDRRKVAGTAGAALSAVLYAGLLYNKASTAAVALGMFFPVALSLGFLESARTGL